ncbi:hypothetical protein PIB30_033129 [Stylosanthes scabra]|uniref:Uncharacterized protein n=1 Tax=Stylosanthes scabra TaxID=79078 RepID=A0ABU6VAM8_9FABA|nr:hypothetical protein [Stylosanthes scabra]
MGANFNNFSICEENWKVMSTKESFYNDVIKETFYFDYQNETIKGDMLKSLGKSWKEVRNKLLHDYYDPRKTLEQNVNARPKGIDEDHWRRKNAANRSKQLYTHTSGSKSMARWRHDESRQQGRDVSRDEVWMMTHKKIDGSYIHQDAQVISVLGKEHQGRVHGMGFRPTPSQLFGRNSQLTGEGAQVQETQRVLEDLRAELAAEKLKRQAIESEVASEKVKRQAMENSLRYLI